MKSINKLKERKSNVLFQFLFSQIRNFRPKQQKKNTSND